MQIRRAWKQIALALLAALAVSGCRGNRSESPPIHLQQNMDFQKRYDGQQENAFFKDGRALRPQVKGTVARGELHTSHAFYKGTRSGKKTKRIPLRLNAEVLKWGQARFNVYCAYCHGHSGNGKGIMVTRRITVPPSSYLEPRLQHQPIGHFFQVISKGIRNMRGLAAQIPAGDRWAIVAYVRALQIAGGARVPLSMAREKGWVTK